MKRAKIGLFLIMAAVLTVLFSCGNDLLPTPFVLGSGNRNSGVDTAPDGLSATHGGYRSITLSWDPKPNAAHYYMYRADSPLDDFVRCGETTANQHKFSVPPTSTIYYKVSAVSLDGRESPQSVFVRGTSLAQPIITDVIGITESGVTVTWYMDNAEEDTYKKDLLYTVYCFDGSTEVAQLALDGAALTDTRASFGDLKPNAQYKYQVEAFLRGDQSNSEKSDKVDAATARAMRPAAPVNLRASRGTSVDKIELSFELPNYVDIALGDNQYQQKPVYFKISRRLYSASGNNEYWTACPYFGSITANAANAGAHGKTFDGYIVGATVKWTDTVARDFRGVEYEYEVRSYVDDTPKVISSDSSKASAVGWALSEGSLDFGKLDYTLNEQETLYASAQLRLEFDFDYKDVTYGYSLVEKIEPIEDGEDNDPSGPVKREINTFTQYNEVKNYAAQMDLTQKTDANTAGRGVYSYEVEIKLDDEIIDTVATIGKVEVSENTDPIIVEGFSVQDGYTDKFVLKWHYQENRKYELYASDDRKTWATIGVVNSSPDDGSTVKNINYSHTYTAQGITPGLTRYFAIRPFRDIGGGSFKQGQMVYAPAASRTLGVPVLSLSADASYSVITAAWTDAQKADAYRIKYWYTEGVEKGAVKIAATVSKSELSYDASNKLIYHLTPLENNTIDAARAGLEIQVEVDALNTGLRAEVGGGEIATTSKETVTKRLVGPALLDPSASRAVSPMDINVSWKTISGASGYYVFRRQFNMNNTAEEGTEAIMYYVPATESPSISGLVGKTLTLDSSNIRVDTTTVKATASFSNSRYTLTDSYMTDGEYEGGYSGHILAYRNQQNDIAQGFSYRYFIVPVVNVGDFGSNEFNYLGSGSKNTSISSYKIQNITYSGASAFEKEGFTIGFGQGVTATKGTYVSSGNVNDRIQIRWSAPAKLASVAGFAPRYTLYRRVSGGATWDTVTSTSDAQWLDTPQERGKTYEYVIGIANGLGAISQPHASRRFIELCGTLRDDRNRPDYLGFLLAQVKVDSVSRDARMVGSNFAEEVKWYSAGVQNPYSSDYNWSIDGYTIYLLNRNVNNGRQWTTITDVPAGGLPNQISQSYTVANDNNRLKVLRDYRHYYKVRSYVLNSLGEKVYCPDPEPNYIVADGTNSDYVKWGARQISADEFAAITSLAMGTAMNWWGNKKGDAMDRNWNGQCGNDTNPGITITESTAAGIVGGNRDIYFNNATPYFVKINGHLYGQCGATGKTPRYYGAEGQAWGDLADPKNKLSTLTITGPGDVNGMYSGSVTIERLGNNNDTGRYKVSYNGQNNLSIEAKHIKSCFTYGANSKEYGTTRELDWSPSGGIANTSPGKWWYPINGNRAGWD